MNRRRIAIWLVGIAAFGGVFGVSSRAQTAPEDQTLAAMFRHGLAETALQYSLAHLERTQDVSLQAKWTQRAMECHAQIALRSSADDDQQWTAANALYEQFALRHPQHARLPWLAWQQSRCVLLHSQSALARYLAAPAAQSLREQALELVRDVMAQTEELLDDIQRRQPIAARQQLGRGSEAPAEQLHKLAVDVALLQCDALLVRARLYETATPDRVAAATEVEARAAEVLARTAENWASKEQLHVAQAVAQFELGQQEQALLQLEQLARRSTNPQVRIRASVYAIERLADERQISRAQPLLVYLEQASRNDAGGAPELSLARLQLALADIPATPEQARQQAMNALVAAAQNIDEDFGSYWRNRAEALLVGSVSSASIDDSAVAMDLMLVEVRQLLASDKREAAIEKLLQFRDNEAAKLRGDTAIKLASQAAALLLREQRWDAAATALEPILNQFPTANGAAEAHLLVIWARTQALRSEPESQVFGTAYETALRRQLATWPDAAASDDPENWLKTWLVARQRQTEMIDVLRKRAIATSQNDVARRSITHWLAQLLHLPEEMSRMQQIQAMRVAAAEAQTEFAVLNAEVASLVAEVFSSWPPKQRSETIQSQLARLSRGIDDPFTKQVTLSAVLLDTIRQRRLESLSNVSSSWQPQDVAPELRLAWTEAFIEGIDQAPINTHRKWLDGLKISPSWIEELKQSPIPLEQAFAFRWIAWTENATEGLQGITQLLKQYPRDGKLQMQLSEALAASGANRLTDSTRIARTVAASSAAGGHLNLSARWRIIRNQLLAGENEAAQRAAQLLLASQPLDSDLWRERFESVAQSPAPK